MDQRQIDDIVRAVMGKLAEEGSAPDVATGRASSPAAKAPAVSGESLPDLGGDEFKTWIGVRNPHRKEVLEDLRRSTAARIAVGRAGPRPLNQVGARRGFCLR